MNRIININRHNIFVFQFVFIETIAAKLMQSLQSNVLLMKAMVA